MVFGRSRPNGLSHCGDGRLTTVKLKWRNGERAPKDFEPEAIAEELPGADEPESANADLEASSRDQELFFPEPVVVRDGDPVSRIHSALSDISQSVADYGDQLDEIENRIAGMRDGQPRMDLLESLTFGVQNYWPDPDRVAAPHNPARAVDLRDLTIDDQVDLDDLDRRFDAFVSVEPDERARNWIERS